MFCVIDFVILLFLFFGGSLPFVDFSEMINMQNQSNEDVFSDILKCNYNDIFYDFDFFKKNEVNGFYATEGYVKEIKKCPPCPKNVKCKMCINSIEITKNKNSDEKIAFRLKSSVLCDDFEIGKKYKFLVQKFNNDLLLSAFFEFFGEKISCKVKKNNKFFKPGYLNSIELEANVIQKKETKRGIYLKKGYVKNVNFCSPCPKGASCAKCQNYIVVSNLSKKFPDEIKLFIGNFVFDFGDINKKYNFLIKKLDSDKFVLLVFGEV